MVSPRAREESVRPRLQSDAAGRPLNFTVRGDAVLRSAHWRVVKYGGFVMGALVFLGLSLRVYMKIRDGHGADTYDNVYGFHILWSQAAALLGSAALIVAGAYSARWWQLWKRSREEGVSVSTVAKDLKRDA